MASVARAARSPDGEQAAKPKRQPSQRKRAASAAAGTAARSSKRTPATPAAPKARALDDPPAHLEAEWAELWRRCLAKLKKQGTYDDVDRPQLDEYVSLLRSADLARTAADAEPFVAGSTDQLVAHPGYQLAERSRSAALKYAQELLLTARQRSIRKLGDGGEEKKDPFDALLAGDLDDEDEDLDGEG
jgi:phage terminase small subunit